MAGVDAVIHSATLHKPHVGSHGRGEFVDTNITGTLNLLEEAVAAGVEPLPLHQHDERLRPGADPGSGRARGLDHRAGPARAAQHLRRHQDRGREPLRARVARPSACPASSCAPRASSPRTMTATMRGRRTTTSTSRSTSCCIAAWISRTPSTRTSWRSSARPRSASAATSSAPPRRSRPTTSPSCTATRPRWSVGCSPTTRRSTRPAAGPCSPSSTASTSTPTPARSWAGHRPTTSARAGRLAAGEDPRSPLALAVGAKGYHAQPTGVYTTRARDAAR